MTFRYIDTIYINKQISINSGDISNFKADCENANVLKVDFENDTKIDVLIDYLESKGIFECMPGSIEHKHVGFITDNGHIFREHMRFITIKKEQSDLKHEDDEILTNAKHVDDEIKHVDNSTKHKDKEIPKALTIKTNGLREPQKEALKYMLSDKKHFFQIPCGCGKTRIYKEYADKKQNEKILIVVPWRILLNQQLEEYFNDASYAVNGEFKHSERSNVIISLPESYKAIPEEIRKSISVVIYDEAHHDYSHTIKDYPFEDNDKEIKFKNIAPNVIDKDVKTFHFSATLDISTIKTNEDDFYVYNSYDAIAKGYIVGFELRFIKISENLNTLEKITKFKNEIMQKIIKKHNHTLILNNTVEDSKMISEMLKVPYIVAETKDKQRHEIFKKFESTEHSAISAVNCISEGVNVPCIDTVIMSDLRCGDISLPQSVGRCVRNYKDKTKGFVYVFVSNCKESQDREFLKSHGIHDIEEVREIFLSKLIKYNLDINNKSMVEAKEFCLKSNELEEVKNSEIVRIFNDGVYFNNFIKETITDYEGLKTLLKCYIKDKIRKMEDSSEKVIPYFDGNYSYNHLQYNLANFTKLHCKCSFLHSIIKNLLLEYKFDSVYVNTFVNSLSISKDDIEKCLEYSKFERTIYVNGEEFKGMKLKKGYIAKFSKSFGTSKKYFRSILGNNYDSINETNFNNYYLCLNIDNNLKFFKLSNVANYHNDVLTFKQ